MMVVRVVNTLILQLINFSTIHHYIWACKHFYIQLNKLTYAETVCFYRFIFIIIVKLFNCGVDPKNLAHASRSRDYYTFKNLGSGKMSDGNKVDMSLGER